MHSSFFVIYERTIKMKKEKENITEAEKMAQKLLDPEEQLKQFGRGKMMLQVPIQDGENTVTELSWDFLSLTGAEYVDAMDRDVRGNNAFRLSNTQAFALFAAAAAKVTSGLDMEDILKRMSMQDAQKAIQVATVFFVASNRVGSNRISNE